MEPHRRRRISRQAIASHMPGRWPSVVVAQGGVTAVVFLVLAALLPQVGLGVWSVPAIVGGTLVVLVCELAVDVRARGRDVDSLEDEVLRLEGHVSDLEPLALRVQELEALRTELEATVADLRAD